MGVWTPRGEEDDEPGPIEIAGLDDLDGGGDDDEITYELDEWSDHDRTLLADRLTTLGAPHSWEGTTLVIADTDEAWVERIMDQVEEELSTAPVDDEEQVAYDLSEWDDDACVSLLDALSVDAIPYDLIDDELLVGAGDEKRVDEIVAALTTPGATLTLGGPASFEAMSEMFVSADELSNDPDDKSATAALIQSARTAASATAPFGMEDGWWDGVVAHAGALADLLESPRADPEQVIDLAAGLRGELRPYI